LNIGGILKIYISYTYIVMHFHFLNVQAYQHDKTWLELSIYWLKETGECNIIVSYRMSPFTYISHGQYPMKLNFFSNPWKCLYCLRAFNLFPPLCYSRQIDIVRSRQYQTILFPITDHWKKQHWSDSNLTDFLCEYTICLRKMASRLNRTWITDRKELGVCVLFKIDIITKP
jgi:hypothetical protein